MLSLPLVLGLAVVVAFAWGAVRLIVIAQPDEWLLRIRNGRLVDAGVGIWVVRRPGDRVARFSSTVQRVAFTAEGLTNERLAVAVDGFILWSVGDAAGAPFVAFPQYHAFQRMLAATVQRQIATWSLDDLLSRQDDLVAELRTRVGNLTGPLGLSLEEVELTRVLPAEDALVRELAAPRAQKVRELAERARKETDERLERRSLEAAAELAEQQAATQREQLEQSAAVAARKQELTQSAALQRSHDEREVAQHQAVLAREGVEAQLERDRLALDAQLDGKRRRVDLRRQAIESLGEAEGNKSQAVRDYQLARLATVKMAESFAQLPLERAEWVTIGDESPATALAGLLAAARHVIKT